MMERQTARRSPRRFRRRLTAAFVIVAAVSAGLVAVVTYVLAREYRWRTVRATAVEETRFALALAPLNLEPETFERFIDVYELRTDAQIVAVGEHTLSSSELGESDIPAGLSNLTEEPTLVETTVSGRPTLVSGAMARDGDRYYLFFSLEQLHESLDELARAAAVSWLGTLVVAGAIGSLVARRTLRPVASTAVAAESIAAGHLDARLPDDATDEFGVLARSFNHMADEVQRLVARLGEAAERERRFTADVAHELRTPLTGMSAAATLLGEQLAELPAPARRPADILVHDVTRLRQLVVELLELAQLDTATSAPERTSLNLRNAVDAVIADAEARRAALMVVDVSPAVFVETEPFALRRIVGNLLDNAIKHGAEPITVRARTGPGTTVRIDVIDEGPGLPPEELEMVFRRFHKSDRSRSSGGSGLGLAIAREHAVRQGGSLVVSNEPGRGARFTLTLQSSPPNAATTAEPGEPALSTGRGSTPHATSAPDR